MKKDVLLSLSSGRKVLQPVVCHRFPQMQAGAFALEDAVRAHRIGDLREYLAVADQLVHQHLAALVVYVVVASAMNQEQVSFQSGGVGDGGDRKSTRLNSSHLA